MTHKWWTLSLLIVASLLSMALWFSASAVVPQLTAEWDLDSSQQSWLTMSVQIGFVAGALGSAMTNLADRIAAHRLIAMSATLGAVFNGCIALFVDTPGPAMVLRFLTGVSLAGVYPPGMKLIATWTKEDRGLGIGLLVGGLTVGSAAPHLFNAIPMFGGRAGLPPWQPVLLVASASALGGAFLAAAFVRPGPLLLPARRFDWRYATRGLSERPSRLANLGYLGHMWELYAMWSWVPIFLITSYRQAGWSETEARLAGFAAVAAGGLGSVVAGRLADHKGRTTISTLSMVASGSCCLTVGLFFDRPAIVTAICLLWGFAVVADSAQFSTAVSELADPEHIGTALTMQTCLGFLLTLVTIRMIPSLVDAVGWEWAFTALAIGPAYGSFSMLRLRSLPEAVKMASGNR